VFGDWAKSSKWMRTSAEFRANPIGAFVDPATIAEAAAAGEGFHSIHDRAMAGKLAPPAPPVDIPTEG
jgi:catechol 2,3-dioxygenase